MVSKEEAFVRPFLPSSLPRLPTSTTLRRQRPRPAKRRPCAALHISPTPIPPRRPREGRHQDYHANVGSVIDSLRDFYPRLLIEEPDLTHFSPGVVFADSTGYRIVGHDAYRAAFWMLRAQVRVFFSSAAVSVQSLFYDDCEGAVYLRWRLTASARMWGGGFIMDGVSVYTFDDRGIVVMHQLENGVRKKRTLLAWEGVWGRPVGAGVVRGHWFDGFEQTQVEEVEELTVGKK